MIFSTVYEFLNSQLHVTIMNVPETGQILQNLQRVNT